MIKFRQVGDFSKTERFLKNAQNLRLTNLLNDYGQKGVDALSQATPIDTGLTAASWTYEIVNTTKGSRLVWSNSNIVDGVSIAILLQYGHGTQNGGYIAGRDYINPAIRPIFDDILSKLGEEVSRL